MCVRECVCFRRTTGVHFVRNCFLSFSVALFTGTQTHKHTLETARHNNDSEENTSHYTYNTIHAVLVSRHFCTKKKHENSRLTLFLLNILIIYQKDLLLETYCVIRQNVKSSYILRPHSFSDDSTYTAPGLKKEGLFSNLALTILQRRTRTRITQCMCIRKP